MSIQFRCEACNRMRPNKLISVHKVDLGKAQNLPPGSLIRHLNYCNDSETCFAGVIKKGKKEQFDDSVELGLHGPND